MLGGDVMEKWKRKDQHSKKRMVFFSLCHCFFFFVQWRFSPLQGQFFICSNVVQNERMYLGWVQKKKNYSTKVRGC